MEEESKLPKNSMYLVNFFFTIKQFDLAHGKLIIKGGCCTLIEKWAIHVYCVLENDLYIELNTSIVNQQVSIIHLSMKEGSLFIVSLESSQGGRVHQLGPMAFRLVV